MDLNNKIIVLTGASSGIGKQILTILSIRKDVKIVAVARHINTIPTIDDIVFPFAADVSTQQGVDNVFDYALSTFGRIDVFIANAGFAYIEKLQEPDWQHIEYIYQLNVFSPIYSLEKLASINKENIAFACTISGAGLASLPAYSLYCSTKAALHHFIQTYRYEQDRRIQITAIYPVATRTSFFDKAADQENTPLPFPVQEAEAVARKIIKGIEKGQKTVYPSILFRLFYPIGRAFPFFLKIYSLLEKQKMKKWLA